VELHIINATAFRREYAKLCTASLAQRYSISESCAAIFNQRASRSDIQSANFDRRASTRRGVAVALGYRQDGVRHCVPGL